MTTPSPITIVLLGTMTAWVAGVFTLAGLLVSKEQKTSEFRQAWIDALRSDIAALIAHTNIIHAYVSGNPGVTNIDLWNATRADYIEANKASTSIKLRLNRNETESLLVLRSMEELENLFREPLGAVQIQKINQIHDAIERDAPRVLKNEWERVKRGEPIYERAKWVALALTACLALIYGIFVVTAFLDHSKSTTSSASTPSLALAPPTNTNTQSVVVIDRCSEPQTSNKISRQTANPLDHSSRACPVVPKSAQR